MSYIISVEALKEKLAQKPENLVIVDVRFDLKDAHAGRKAYLENHIPDAIYLDLNQDLSSKAEKHGGNHPLPDINLFATKLGHVGIDQDTTVVVYDQGSDIFAGRLWWILDFLGSENVYILDGGYDHWVAAGNEVTEEVPLLNMKKFIAKPKLEAIVNIEQVKARDASTTLLDARAKERYLGGHEPLHGKSGHIPGAKSYFWKGVLTEDGTWKDTKALEIHFADLYKNKEIIVSCGSGVSACSNIAGLKQAGFTNVKLYPGSFSDWISYEENEIVTEEE